MNMRQTCPLDHYQHGGWSGPWLTVNNAADKTWVPVSETHMIVSRSSDGRGLLALKDFDDASDNETYRGNFKSIYFAVPPYLDSILPVLNQRQTVVTQGKCVEIRSPPLMENKDVRVRSTDPVGTRPSEEIINASGHDRSWILLSRFVTGFLPPPLRNWLPQYRQAGAGRFGCPVSWFAGYWNCLAWVFGAASMSSVLANKIVSMYMFFHPELSHRAAAPSSAISFARGYAAASFCSPTEPCLPSAICKSHHGDAISLLIVVCLLPPPQIPCTGCYITAGRTFWTLAHDNTTPFSRTFHNTFNATVTCGCLITNLGCIYVGSTTAFSTLVGSFVHFSSLSYITAILPHLPSGRSGIRLGYFLHVRLDANRECACVFV
ncbi:hypothetical protein GX48_05235 [Paracoccidioides brasiliensis]|nr:hypothetical protein GX48_05235 [Paracoccidioides brasiliensis]